MNKLRILFVVAFLIFLGFFLFEVQKGEVLVLDGQGLEKRDVLDEAQLQEILRKFESGDADSSVTIADHYFALRNEKSSEVAMKWLERGHKSGALRASDRLIGIHLSKGRCDAARAILISVADRQNEAFIARLWPSQVDDCFKRPVGEGDWKTQVGV